MLIVFEVFFCSQADFLCGGWYVFSQKFDKLVELMSRIGFHLLPHSVGYLENSGNEIFLIIFRLQFLSAVFLLAGEFLKVYPLVVY